DYVVFIFCRTGVKCLSAWHFDDGMGGSNNSLFLQEMKHKLHLCFGITDMGAITKYLGLQFEHD
ncbi:hypothetical protein J3A83DRAFT_4068524, partial [Scleroderma citrinum]